MATEAQVKAFIEAIAPCAQNAYKILGKVKPSVCIGMACVESGYGTAGSVKYNSFLGHKVGSGKTATKYWGGKFFTSKTMEEYTVGNHTMIQAAFRSYDSMQQCVLNFYELLNTKLYDRVKADADYKTQMAQIKICQYMTSSTEVNSVITIIDKYDLTRYDAVAPVQQSTDQSGAGQQAEYYPVYKGTSPSIVNALVAVGEKDTSYKHRQVIAAVNGFTNYCGKTMENLEMVRMLKDGRLKKSITVIAKKTEPEV